jgi:hypothetical protein
MNTLRLLLLIVILTGTMLTGATSAQGPSNQIVHLPMVNTPFIPNIFGIEVILGGLSNATVRARADELNATWVRINGLRWNEIQPTEGGGYNMAALATLDSDLRAARDLGMQATVIVHGAPPWAQTVTGSACGPIRTDALDDFAKFMGDMVTRYSYSPYNVTYWELGNEPDATLSVGGTPPPPYGCWGDPNVPDYNGAAYAAMLAAAYPAIKAADANAKVILGGLLYACVPGVVCDAGAQYQPSTFLDGILKAGGGAYFDIFAFHSYPYWNDAPNQNRDWELNDARWKPYGGILLGKLSFIRATLAEYGLQQKPIIMNEGALLCYERDPACGPNGFFEDKASYTIRLYARSSANGISGVFYYSLNEAGWLETGLLDRSQQPRPAFTALKHMISLVGKSQGAATNVTAEYGSASDIEAYRFNRGNDQVDVVWKLESTTTTPISLPASKFISATTSQGSAITPLTVGSDITLDVGFMPIYIVRQP